MPRRFLTVDVLRDTAAIQAAAADIRLNGTATLATQDPEFADEWQLFDADTAGVDRLRFPVDCTGIALHCILWMRQTDLRQPHFGPGPQQRALAYSALNPYGIIWDIDCFTLGPQAAARAAARSRSRSPRRYLAGCKLSFFVFTFSLVILSELHAF